MMIDLLANVAAAPPHPDPMISGNWLIALVAAIIAGLGSAGAAWIVAWRKGEKKGRSERITLESPLPDVNVTRKYSPPTFGQHMEIVRRVSKLEEKSETIDDKVDANDRIIRDLVAKHYVEFLTAAEERERRITLGFSAANRESERVLSEKLDGIARGFHGRVDALIDATPQTRTRKQ